MCLIQASLAGNSRNAPGKPKIKRGPRRPYPRNSCGPRLHSSLGNHLALTMSGGKVPRHWLPISMVSKRAGEAFLGLLLLLLLCVLILKCRPGVAMFRRLVVWPLYGLIRKLVILLHPPLDFPEVVASRERLLGGVPRPNRLTAINAAHTRQQHGSALCPRQPAPAGAFRQRQTSTKLAWLRGSCQQSACRPEALVACEVRSDRRALLKSMPRCPTSDTSRQRRLLPRRS